MPDFTHEILHGREQGKIICGVDEVGRGPLAGPVVAAALVLPDNMSPEILKRIRDSKAMTSEQRENLYAPLTETCAHSFGIASVEEIDAINILQATMLAMQHAVKGLMLQIDIALIDGNRAPKLSCRTATIVGGDAVCLSIAAASIIAKVWRDRHMAELATAHPGYGWERNAGYGTAQHLKAMRELGVTPWHRKSFAPVRVLLEDVA